MTLLASAGSMLHELRSSRSPLLGVDFSGIWICFTFMPTFSAKAVLMGVPESGRSPTWMMARTGGLMELPDALGEFQLFGHRGLFCRRG